MLQIRISIIRQTSRIIRSQNKTTENVLNKHELGNVPRMRIGVILASHGEFARAALGVVEMIAGKQPDVVALGPTAEKSLETFVAERRTAYEELNAECDLDL